MMTYQYSNSKGEATTNIVEIVTQEVELLAYVYIEKNGKRPSLELINEWTHKALKTMGWYDDE